MKPYFHSLLILGSFLLVFVWQESDLQRLNVPLIGLLIFLFLVVSIKNKRNLNLGGPASPASLGGPINFFILNTISLLLIFSTGGINSNLFFLLYFLLFAVAFIMNPKSVFIFPVGAVILFWQEFTQAITAANLLKIGSIALFSPVAYFFGANLRWGEKKEDENLKTKERAKSSADQITDDVEELLESGKEKLDEEEIDELDDILEETESLREEEK